MNFKKALHLAFCVISLPILAQKKNNHLNYYIKQSSGNIKIDGKADEKEWKDAKSASDFFQVLPMDTSMAKVKTEVKFSYDKKNLYLLVINYNFIEGPNVVESMKRDWNFGRNDNDLLFFDTFNDLTNGFSFGSNARGGQWDGLMSGAGMNLSWENKWKSEVGFDHKKWVWEAAIPFKTLRYKKDIKSWGLNMSRLDLKTTEKSAWAPVPRQFPTASLAFTGNLVWDSIPPAPGKNISIIPFLYTSTSKNFTTGADRENDLGIGFDAKIGLTSSLNMDLSVLPDFSQVEVDVQQTNLDRFELFFPERRQFFLENGDIFNNFGSLNIRPFFSRRIGLNSAMLYGAKVSGKIDKNWRIGAMNMQTAKDSKANAGSNYSIISVQRQLFARSYVSAIYVDRQTSQQGESDPNNQFNRTAGLEYYLASKDAKWNGKASIIKTFTPLIKTDNLAYLIQLQRSTKKYSLGINAEQVDAGVRGNEVGFIRRSNYFRLSPEGSYLFFPKTKNKILSHGPMFMSSVYFNKADNKYNEYTNFIAYRLLTRRQDAFTIWTANDYVKLNADFDPTGYTKEILKKDQEHSWVSWGTIFNSRPQKLFTYGFETRYGGYFADGNRLRLDTDFAYRFQPYVSIAVKSSYNRLNFAEDQRLPAALKNTTHNLWLVGPRVDVTLSNKLFLTNFLQYNNQSNNFNINTRFQWRYSPASDLYLVYTDNYTADNFLAKNRALVLKFNYWWNV